MDWRLRYTRHLTGRTREFSNSRTSARCWLMRGSQTPNRSTISFSKCGPMLACQTLPMRRIRTRRLRRRPTENRRRNHSGLAGNGSDSDKRHDGNNRRTRRISPGSRAIGQFSIDLLDVGCKPVGWRGGYVTERSQENDNTRRDIPLAD